MPTTPRLGLYYPVLADDPDVPDSVRQLALSVEAASIGWVVGDFKWSFQSADHDQFILCDGTPRNRAGLPAPYLALIDSILGAHPDPTKVRTPNGRRRSIMGADPGGVSILSPTGAVIPNLGAITGEELHRLLAAESGVNSSGSTVGAPDHNHGNVQIQMTNGFGAPSGQIHIASQDGLLVSYFDYFGAGSPAGAHAHGFNARNADNPHNVVHPVMFANLFIATGGGGTGTGGGGGGGASGVGGPVNLVASVRQNVIHDLGTELVSVTTWDSASGAQVDAAVEIVDLNTISLLSSSDIIVNLVVIPAALPLP